MSDSASAADSCQPVLRLRLVTSQGPARASVLLLPVLGVIWLRGPTERALRSCDLHKVPENALRPGPLHLAAAGSTPLHVPAGRSALPALAFDYWEISHNVRVL